MTTALSQESSADVVITRIASTADHCYSSSIYCRENHPCRKLTGGYYLAPATQRALPNAKSRCSHSQARLGTSEQEQASAGGPDILLQPGLRLLKSWS